MQNNRLMKEYRELSRGQHDPEISLSLESEVSLLRWRALLQGPAGTPYEGGRFEVKIACPVNYPLAPPQVRFVTRVFHPNVLFKVRNTGAGAQPAPPSADALHRPPASRCGAVPGYVAWQTGEICLDILKEDAWTPAWTIQSVCRAILALLSSPEADSPLNCDAGNLIRHGDDRGFRSMARMYTQLHASANAKPPAQSC